MSTAAQADDSQEPGFLGAEANPLIITASRGKQQDISEPFSTDLISGNEFIQNGAYNLPETLRYTPGVSMQKTGRAMGSPYIRGFTGYHNVLMIDGIRFNNSIFRSGPNQYWGTVDTQALERIEMVKGASSVLYGSDAIGGAVNAHTLSPYAYDRDNQVAGRVFVRGSSAEQGATGRVELSTADGNLGVIAGITGESYGNLIAGGGTGEQDNTGYHDWAADLKLEFFVSDSSRIVLFHQHYDLQDSPRTHSTVDGISWQGTDIGNRLKRDFDHYRDLSYIQFHSEPTEGPIKEAHSSLSWHHARETQTQLRGGNYDKNHADVGTLGHFSSVVLDGGSSGAWTLGYDWYHDFVNTSQTRNGVHRDVQGSLAADDAQYDLLGIFLQNRLEIAPRLELLSGARFTWVKAQADRMADFNTADPTDSQTLDQDWTHLAGSARLSYALEPDCLSVFGGWSQGFRAPNLNDMTTGFDDIRSGDVQGPSPDLDPETYDNFELGLKGVYDRVSWGTTAFYTLEHDRITEYDTGVETSPGSGSYIWSKTNAGDGWIAGVEMELAIKLDSDWTMFANATWIDGRQDVTDSTGATVGEEYRSKFAPAMANLGARFEPQGYQWYIQGVLTLADKADHQSSADLGDTQRQPQGGTPGYITASLGAGWSPSAQWDLNFTLENITNEDYRVHGSGSNSAGINAIASVSYKF